MSSPGRTPDNSQMWTFLKPILPGYSILMLGIWGFWVMGEIALYRKVLRGEETPNLPLRLGVDEGRVLGAQLYKDFRAAK